MPPETEGDPVAQATTLLAETLGGDVVEMGQEGDPHPPATTSLSSWALPRRTMRAGGGGDLPGHL